MLPWFQSTAQQLSTRRQKRALHHALLLNGNAGIGKHIFAQDVARNLLCNQLDGNAQACGQCQSCLLFKAETHPDFYQIESDKQIGVDAVRQAIEKLSTTTQLGGNKVLIIQQADSMTESASNALLKTLEEPTANTYMLLVTAHKHRLLPTIRSRCENVQLPSPNEQETLHWLQTQGVTNVEVGDIRAYGNAPYILLDVFSEGAKSLSFSVFEQQVIQLVSGNADALELAKQWQEDAARVTEWCTNYWMKQAKAHAGSSKHIGNFNHYQHCLQVKQSLLHAGVNKVVLLSGLLQLFKASS